MSKPEPLDLESAAGVFKEMMDEVDLQLEIESIRSPGISKTATLSWASHAASIFTAQALARTATAPMERVRLIMQTQAASNVPRRSYIQGLYHAAYRIPNQQGWPALWRSNGVNVLRALPGCVVVFSSNDAYKEMMCGAGMAERKSSLGKRVTFAGMFGLCATIVGYPLDVARTRLALDMTKGTKTSIQACLQRIIREEGWRTLYRGVGLSLLSSVPYATIAFTAYDNLKGRYERAARKKEGSLEENQTTSFADSLLGQKRKHSIMAGSMAFTFASVCVFPIDTLRRRLIVDGAPGHQQRLYSRLPKAAPVAAASTKTGAAAAGSAGGSAAAAAAATTVGRAGLGESEFSTNVRTKVNLSSGGNGPGEGMAEAAATRGPPAVQAALRIWYEEGIIGFYRGLFPSVVRSLPRAAIMFVTYDVMKSALTPNDSSMRRTLTRKFNRKKE